MAGLNSKRRQKRHSIRDMPRHIFLSNDRIDEQNFCHLVPVPAQEIAQADPVYARSKQNSASGAVVNPAGFRNHFQKGIPIRKISGIRVELAMKMRIKNSDEYVVEAVGSDEIDDFLIVLCGAIRRITVIAKIHPYDTHVSFL